MIRKEGEYLVIDEPCSPASDSRCRIPEPEPEIFYAQGSIRDRLGLIKQQIAKLKEEKQARMKFHSQEKDFLEKVRQTNTQQKEAVSLNMTTPQYLFKLINRVDELESKIGKSELYSQIIHKKGNLLERIKVLQTKLHRLSELPNEVVIKNIQNYNSLTEDRQQQFKYLFLYEQFLKTQGLLEEYKTIKDYLGSLKVLHEEGSTMQTDLIKLTKQHNDILAKSIEAQKVFEQTHKKLAEQYKALSAELDQLQKI